MNPFGPLYSFDFVLLVVCAGGFYKAADIENVPGMLWAGISIIVFFLTWRVLGWGIPGELLGQVLLLAGITLVRIWRSRRT